MRGAYPGDEVTASGFAQTPDGNNLLRFVAYSMRETGGAAATVNIRDGGASGTILEARDLAANEEVPITEVGNLVTGGVYVQIASGTAAVVIFGT